MQPTRGSVHAGGRSSVAGSSTRWRSTELQEFKASRPALPGGLLTPMLPAPEVRSEGEVSSSEEEEHQDHTPAGEAGATAVGDMPGQPSKSVSVSHVDLNDALCRLLGVGCGGWGFTVTGVAAPWAGAAGGVCPQVSGSPPVAPGTAGQLQELLGGVAGLGPTLRGCKRGAPIGGSVDWWE